MGRKSAHFPPAYLISCHSSPFFGRSGPPPLKNRKTSILGKQHSLQINNTSYKEVVFQRTLNFFSLEFGLFQSSEEHYSFFFSFLRSPSACPVKITVSNELSSTYNHRQIVETLYSNKVTSENRGILAPPLSPAFNVGVFVVF